LRTQRASAGYQDRQFRANTVEQCRRGANHMAFLRAVIGLFLIFSRCRQWYLCVWIGMSRILTNQGGEPWTGRFGQ
jgi:hypothetical protein